jgi:hypothetical protein
MVANPLLEDLGLEPGPDARYAARMRARNDGSTSMNSSSSGSESPLSRRERLLAGGGLGVEPGPDSKYRRKTSITE